MEGQIQLQKSTKQNKRNKFLIILLKEHKNEYTRMHK